MSDKTGIEWTDATWNPVRGCSRVSEGCRHCYAEAVAARFCGPGQPYEGLADRARSGSKWTGVVRLIDEHLMDPLRWKRPRRIFVNSMSDLFHEALPDDAIDRVFAVMAMAPQHTFQVLTKRPARMKEYFAAKWYRRVFDLYVRWREEGVWTMPNGYAEQYALGQSVGAITCGDHDRRFLPNVWLGTSVENQTTADERIPLLLETPAAVRFISAEPLIGPVRLKQQNPDGFWPPNAPQPDRAWLRHKNWPDDWQYWTTGLDWVIVGGESGPSARACRPAWVRSIVEQCAAGLVPCFVKQLGANILTRNDDGFEGEFSAENPTEWPDHLAIEDRVEDHPHGFREDYQGADVRLHLRSRKGGDPSEWPMDLRVRQFPRIGAQA